MLLEQTFLYFALAYVSRRISICRLQPHFELSCNLLSVLVDDVIDSTNEEMLIGWINDIIKVADLEIGNFRLENNRADIG